MAPAGYYEIRDFVDGLMGLVFVWCSSLHAMVRPPFESKPGDTASTVQHISGWYV